MWFKAREVCDILDRSPRLIDSTGTPTQALASQAGCQPPQYEPAQIKKASLTGPFYGAIAKQTPPIYWGDRHSVGLQ
jgi:hypothetical protein